MTRPRCVAIIPARGGSKGVPRKNIRDLAGRPLIAHAIGAAKDALLVDRVFVSTDDTEIAEVARRHGAEVIERPAALASDGASSESALLHALTQLRAEGEDPELVMMIQCTSPLTSAADLDGTVQRLLDAGADSSFSAVPFHHFLWQEDDGGAVRGVGHDGAKRKRRQDLAHPPLLENGAVYVMRVEPFVESETRFCGATVAYVADAERALEIDDPLDFAKAEAAARFLDRRSAAERLPGRPSAVVFDFDGVFTDNAVLVKEDGTESVRCDRGDGMGLGLLRAAGIPLLILSKERNPVVTARAKKLRMECLQGIDDKLPALLAWLAERDLDPATAIFVGNDVNDLECMRGVGFAACPSDAHESASGAADLVLSKPGGHGAVRELCDLLLARLR
ncbi:MAG: acylneuraminate cytidylyltransferase [Deltaproteobacteria bacterium]|nr:acylneuraminate cytidylyltransferase [Deltaproteobacteria bacterium]